MPSKDNVVDKESDQQDNTHDDTGDDDIFDNTNHALNMSPFKDLFEEERIKGNQDIQSSINTGQNIYHGEIILNKLFTFLPSVSIWSDLLSGDLQRFSKNCQMQINECKKSTAISEALFKNAKVLLFKDKKHRIDEFVIAMRESYHQSAMDFVDKVTYTPSQKQHVHWPLPEEMWDRRSKFPNQLHKVPNQLGSYQHQPSPACSKNMCSQNDTQKDRSASVPVKKKAQGCAIVYAGLQIGIVIVG